MAGNVEAAHVCLRIILARIKVLGLAEPNNRQHPRCQQPQTVILVTVTGMFEDARDDQ